MAIKRRFHKKQNGEKVASWGYDFYDIFKQRHQKSGFKTKPDAQRAEAKAIEEANAGKKQTQILNLKKSLKNL